MAIKIGDPIYLLSSVCLTLTVQPTGRLGQSSRVTRGTGFELNKYVSILA